MGMEFKISDDVKKQPIEWLEDRGPEVMQYLRDNGFKTCLDIIHRQDEIPVEIAVPIKRKMIFGI